MLITFNQSNGLIVIIGGGIAGVTTALALAKKGYRVLILETKEDLLASSSDATPCRLGTGFHYMDEETATRYLEESLSVVKQYPGFIRGDMNDPLFQWHYYIVNNSLFSVEEIIDNFRKLKRTYAKFVNEDINSKQFGEPEEFYKIMGQDEHNGVNPQKVILGIKTCERIFHWPEFKRHLLNEIKNQPNINVLTNATVTEVNYRKDTFGYTVCVQVGDQPEIYTFSTSLVVMASWYSIANLNYNLNIYNETGPPTYRLKALLEVKLPKSLHKTPSSFFCFGPHASFTNLGNGTGYLTYEPVTNLAQSTGIHFPKEFQRYLNGEVSEEEKQHISKKIIEGAALYMPDMLNAKPGELKFGTVQTLNGPVDINSRTSPHHARQESGVKEEQHGIVTNRAMKLLYFNSNAEETTKLIEKHQRNLSNLENIYKNFASSFPRNPSLNMFMLVYIQKYLYDLYDIKKTETNTGMKNHKLRRPSIDVLSKLKHTILFKNNMLRELQEHPRFIQQASKYGFKLASKL